MLELSCPISLGGRTISREQPKRGRKENSKCRSKHVPLDQEVQVQKEKSTGFG